MKQWIKETLYFPWYVFKSFFKHIYSGISDILRPSNLSYITFILSMFAWYYKKLSMMGLLVICVALYILMEWVSGDFKKEIREKER